MYGARSNLIAHNGMALKFSSSSAGVRAGFAAGRANQFSRPRAISGTSATRYAYKDSQDRETLNPKSNSEETRSGTADDVAAESDAAFDPAKTSPETEKRTAGQEGRGKDKGDAGAAGNGGNPLEFSGANDDMSKPPKGQSGASEGGKGEKSRKSGFGGLKKEKR